MKIHLKSKCLSFIWIEMFVRCEPLKATHIYTLFISTSRHLQSHPPALPWLSHLIQPDLFWRKYETILLSNMHHSYTCRNAITILPVVDVKSSMAQTILFALCVLTRNFLFTFPRNTTSIHIHTSAHPLHIHQHHTKFTNGLPFCV